LSRAVEIGSTSRIFPSFAVRLLEAIRLELYVKITIVILGGFIAVVAASNSLLRTRCSCVEAARSSKL
jgi:hypothetical protein